MASAKKLATKSPSASAITSKNASITSDKKLAVNRNVYESVPAQQTVIVMKKTAVNRNIYEAVAVEAGGPAKSTSKSVSGGGSGGATEEAVSTKATDEVSSSRLRRRKEQEKEKFFATATRSVVIGCSALLTAVVLIALIVTAIWLTNRKTEPQPPPPYGKVGIATYGREKCIRGFLDLDGGGKFNNTNPTWRQCVLVEPPRKTDESCLTVACSRTTHQLPISTPLETTEAYLHVEYWNYYTKYETNDFLDSENTFCVHGMKGHSEHLHVCLYHQCTFRYVGNGTFYEAEHFASSWEDNCDEPNPCWELDEGRRRFMNADSNTTALVFSREACKSPTKRHKCKSYSPLVGAVVWLQHLRCDVNNSDQIGKYCQGYPMELWECASCQNSPPNIPEFVKSVCSDGETPSLDDGCVISCTRRSDNVTRYVAMPNGVPCNDAQTTAQSVRAYCALGICMTVEKHRQRENWDLSTIDDVETCKKKREENLKKQPRFSLPGNP